jgi:hypothetical protein
MSLLAKRGLKPLLSLEMPDKILEKNIFDENILYGWSYLR